jgi:hypothetical protein
VRVFREMRIELEAPPRAPEWPDGLRVVPFDPERDALEFRGEERRPEAADRHVEAGGVEAMHLCVA